MSTEDTERDAETPSLSPVNDRLARMMDWIGLSAAVGMIVAALIIAI